MNLHRILNDRSNICYFVLDKIPMKKLILLFTVVLIGSNVQAQVPKFDKLEMLFSQRHYKKVYRKSGRLLDKPEYDYSMLPSYYRSLSTIQLAQNSFWNDRHPNALTEAKELFLSIKESEHSEAIFNAHMFELAWVKNDMTTWASDLKRMGEQKDFEEVQALMVIMFDDLPDVVLPGQVTEELIENESIETPDASDLRAVLVHTAKKHIGTPYVWAGNTPSGFDCSGFTGYVMSESGLTLPRRSEDQYNESQKVKRKNVRKGDLVFFSNGAGISHVGMIVSEKGEPLTMIHSSSSQGIILTEIDKSEYWSKRLHGFGTFVK